MKMVKGDAALVRYTECGYFCPLFRQWFRLYRGIMLETFCSLN